MTTPENNQIFERMELITGSEAFNKLTKTRVAVFGIGGVGSWAVEALVRSGVVEITIIDDDVICPSNVNRQLQANSTNTGEIKVLELKKHLEKLNPEVRVTALQKKFEPINSDTFHFSQYDYVLDCIDSISCKVELIRCATASGATLFSAMGAASKMAASQIEVASIWESHGCRLARTIRRNLRQAGFEGDFKVVFSAEELPPAKIVTGEGHLREVTHGSAMHITASFGMQLAGLVVCGVCD